MPIVINQIKYLNASEVIVKLGITRQTLWRWRQEGKIPDGRRYRGRQVIFSPEEVELIEEYANRIEPVERPDTKQATIFDFLEKQG